jgi:hypothetical protein
MALSRPLMGLEKTLQFGGVGVPNLTTSPFSSTFCLGMMIHEKIEGISLIQIDLLLCYVTLVDVVVIVDNTCSQ